MATPEKTPRRFRIDNFLVLKTGMGSRFYEKLNAGSCQCPNLGLNQHKKP